MLKQPQVIKSDDLRLFHLLRTGSAPGGSPYKAADIQSLCQQYLPRDFKGMVKAVLEVEAPLSEELFLRRIVWLFGREKVTKVVWQDYEQKMYGCQRCGIIRRNGFLYLENGQEIQFRGPGDIERDIKQIAPEELAAGMLEILKQNVTADKNGLYRSLVSQCGINRVGKTINEIWGNPKFCVTAKSGANRAKFIMGGRRVKRLPPC